MISIYFINRQPLLNLKRTVGRNAPAKPHTSWWSNTRLPASKSPTSWTDSFPKKTWNKWVFPNMWLGFGQRKGPKRIEFENYVVVICEFYRSCFFLFWQVFYNSDMELSEDVIKEMRERKCLVSLLQEIVAPVSPERRQSNSSNTPQISLNHQKMNAIEGTLCSFVYGDSKDPHNPSEDSYE